MSLHRFRTTGAHRQHVEQHRKNTEQIMKGLCMDVIKVN